MPVAPMVKTRPPSMAGVARGPTPAIDGRVAHWIAVRPQRTAVGRVVRDDALVAGPRCSCVTATPSASTKPDQPSPTACRHRARGGRIRQSLASLGPASVASRPGPWNCGNDGRSRAGGGVAALAAGRWGCTRRGDGGRRGRRGARRGDRLRHRRQRRHAVAVLGPPRLEHRHEVARDAADAEERPEHPGRQRHARQADQPHAPTQAGEEREPQGEQRDGQDGHRARVRGAFLAARVTDQPDGRGRGQREHEDGDGWPDARFHAGKA